jgi:hypothetical protein
MISPNFGTLAPRRDPKVKIFRLRADSPPSTGTRAFVYPPAENAWNRNIFRPEAEQNDLRTISPKVGSLAPVLLLSDARGRPHPTPHNTLELRSAARLLINRCVAPGGFCLRTCIANTHLNRASHCRNAIAHFALSPRPSRSQPHLDLRPLQAGGWMRRC